MRRRLVSKKKIFQAFLTSFLFCVVLISFVPVARALTDEERCQQFQSQFIIDVNGKKVNTVGALPACGSYSSFSTLVVKGINIALAFAGAGAALFIIIGGYWYLTSAGNEEAAEKGRKTMVNAVIGLAAIILSFTIVRVVGNLLTSSTGTPEAPSSTTDTSGSGGGNGTNVNPNSLTSADIAALGDTVQISDYQSDGTVKVDAVISGQSKIDLAKKACSVTSLSSGALRVEFEGGLVGTAQLVCNTPTLCTASKVLPASTFTKTGRVQAYICGTIVAQKTILISN